MTGLFWCEWNKHFRLMDDIDLSEFTGAEFNIIGYPRDAADHRLFTGVFDGNGKKISNFSYTTTGRYFIGLFAYVSGEGKTTDEMQRQATFASWDFVGENANGTEDVWSICEGVHYPKLTWQFVIGNFDGDVNFDDLKDLSENWLSPNRVTPNEAP